MKVNSCLMVFFLFFLSCNSDNQTDQYQNIPIAFTSPSNFPNIAYNIAANPVTKDGFELGKKLFYDGRLSSDGLVSCGFCHIQADAFTHHGHTFSHGVGEEIGTRNTPPIQNLAYQTTFMYDGATTILDFQPIIPITSAIEMNGNFADIIAMLQADANYNVLFKRAFANGKIDSENLLKALTQFMVIAVSSNSKFDKFRRNENGVTLTIQEKTGYDLFQQKCASCHATDIFTDNSFRNNGLTPNPAINDLGRYLVTNFDSDKYKFKVPSLRNIEKTAPYMHDGRFFNLEGVLNHYSSGVSVSATLDATLNQNGVVGIPLTAAEKLQLIAFLKTLADYEFLSDKRFSEF